MEKIRKIINKYLYFILGIIFASSVTVLADACTTTLGSDKVTLSSDPHSQVAIEYLYSTANSLNTRMTKVDVDGELSHIEFMTSSGATHGGFVDFHYGGDVSDHTARIIESANGVIDIQAYSGIVLNGTNIKDLFLVKEFTNSSTTSISAGSAIEKTFNVAVSGYTPVGIVQAGGGGTTGTGFIDAYLTGNTASLWISNPSSSSKSISSAFVVVFYIKSGYVTVL